jgi:hypothetical protein
MNPLEDLRVDDATLRSVDPLLRARLRMEAAERVEEESDRLRRQERAEIGRAKAEEQYIRDRMELATQGYLSREAGQVHQEAELRRAGRLAELRAEVERLEARGAGGGWKPPEASDIDRALARNAAEADAWGSPPIMRQRVLAAESAHRAAVGAEARRAGPVVLRASGAVRVPGPRRSLPGGPPPVSAPQYAHMMPGDW